MRHHKIRRLTGAISAALGLTALFFACAPLPARADAPYDWVADIKQHYMDPYGLVSGGSLDAPDPDHPGQTYRQAGHWDTANALLWTSLYYIARKRYGDWNQNGEDTLALFHHAVRQCQVPGTPGLFYRHPENHSYDEQDDYLALAAASHILDSNATLAKEIYQYGVLHGFAGVITVIRKDPPPPSGTKPFPVYVTIPNFVYGVGPEADTDFGGIFGPGTWHLVPSPDWLGRYPFIAPTFAMAADDLLWLVQPPEILGAWIWGFSDSMSRRAGASPSDQTSWYLGWLMSHVVDQAPPLLLGAPIRGENSHFLHSLKADFPGEMSDILGAYFNNPKHPLAVGFGVPPNSFHPPPPSPMDMCEEWGCLCSADGTGFRRVGNDYEYDFPLTPVGQVSDWYTFAIHTGDNTPKDLVNPDHKLKLSDPVPQDGGGDNPDDFVFDYQSAQPNQWFYGDMTIRIRFRPRALGERGATYILVLKHISYLPNGPEEYVQDVPRLILRGIAGPFTDLFGHVASVGGKQFKEGLFSQDPNAYGYDFGNVAVGQTSQDAVFYITPDPVIVNPTHKLTITSLDVIGTNPEDFDVSRDNVGPDRPFYGEIGIHVHFHPRQAGLRTATIRLAMTHPRTDDRGEDWITYVPVFLVQGTGTGGAQ